MSTLFDRVLLPVADPEDAAGTAEALSNHEFGSVLVVHVVEKAGGAVDKASVEQREEHAEEMFEAVRSELGDPTTVETDIVYGTDVAETIFDAAGDYDATAIVITPRGGSRWVRLLTGDVALSLVTENDRPVVVLPETERANTGDSSDEDATDETGEEEADGE
jgi:nucleotide-binding universal stress UspA family protein